MFEAPSRDTNSPPYVPPINHGPPWPSTATPRAQRPNWLIVIGVVGVCALFAGLGLWGLLREEAGKADDVSIWGCSDASGFAEVSYQVTNTSSSTRSYRITFEARDIFDKRIGTGSGVVDAVAPGDTARDSTTFPIEGNGESCRVVSVR